MKKIVRFALLAGLAAGQQTWAYDTIRFQDPPIKADEMARPVAAAAAGARLYVVDEKKSVLLIYEGGRLIKVVGRPGTDKAAFRSPQGVCVGPTGRVFVADTGNSRIQILDQDGNFLWFFGSRGSDAGMLKDPRSVSVGTDGRVYVADTGNDRVQVFTDDGILLFLFGGKASAAKESGRFESPARVEVDLADNIYVMDSSNDRILKFDASANFLQEYNLLGSDFAVDDYGYLYVLDPKNGKVIEQAPDGTILGKFGSYGSGTGQMKKPGGIAIGSDGTVIVLDTGNNRIHRVEVANKLKTEPLAPNRETKLLVSGPSRSWPVAAEALAPFGADAVYAYLPKEGQFVVLGGDGKEKSRFGTKVGKAPSVTRGTQGFAVNKKLGLYVSDTPDNRLQHFTVEGVWKANMAESTGFFDSKKKEGRVKDPRGVAINEKGTVYVADAGNVRIDAFSPEGVFLFGFGPQVGAYTLSEPTAVAWDKEGFVYFADKGLKRVFKCEPSGAFIKAFGEEGEGPGQFLSPSSLAFDGNNYVYVLDDKLRRISVYTKQGRWMTDLFAGGKQERELTEPVALAVQGDKLLVADKGKGRIVTFDLHPYLAAPVSVSTASKDGMVSLNWPAVSDAWTAGYRVLRSTDPMGPFDEMARTETPRYHDEKVVPYTEYWYQVGTIAKTKDLGTVSRPVSVYVAGAFNKPPVEISTITIGNIFSANYKWYLKNPAGSVLVTNNVNVPFQNVKLTFRLKEFMDFGFDTEVKRLEPQQAVAVPLIATLNNRILEVSEDTPVQAEFTLTYFESGKSQTVSLTKPLRVYSRNAITWENPARIANFITPNDPPVRDFQVEALRDRPRSELAEALNRGIVTAMHLWDALSEAGVQFQDNPNNPYQALREDPNFPVDYSQFPRDTLKRKTGQCDDLSTLLVAMLYGANVRAAILDYPGHMALMFDTGASDPIDAGLPESDMVKHQGTYWLPLEATLIGKPFPEAYRKALYAYKTEHEKGQVRILDPQQAWADFEPATLPDDKWSPDVPKAASRAKRFSEEVFALAGERHKFLRKQYEARLKDDGKDVDARVELGVLEYQHGDKDAAAAEFNKALAIDPKNSAALNNLAGISLLSGDNARAEEQYLKAADADPEDGDIWLNLVKVEVRLKNREKADEYGKNAVTCDPSLEPAVGTLLKNLK